LDCDLLNDLLHRLRVRAGLLCHLLRNLSYLLRCPAAGRLLDGHLGYGLGDVLAACHLLAYLRDRLVYIFAFCLLHCQLEYRLGHGAARIICHLRCNLRYNLVDVAAFSGHLDCDLLYYLLYLAVFRRSFALVSYCHRYLLRNLRYLLVYADSSIVPCRSCGSLLLCHLCYGLRDVAALRRLLGYLDDFLTHLTGLAGGLLLCYLRN
jgi:hypothetical protein